MIRRVFALIIIIIGILVFIYPRIYTEYTDYIFKNDKDMYVESISNMNEEEIKTKSDELTEYNESLKMTDQNDDVNSSDIFSEKADSSISSEDREKEESVKPFAYIDVPKLDEFLPIYLGATETNLYSGLAHIDGTSMPIGGIDTHSVLAGHRGYSKARLLRYIDQLKPGDKFYIYVLGNKMSYEVESQVIIFPHETEYMKIQEGKDLVSLLSCHPYPYMSHRIVVTGRRIPNDSENFDLNAKINENAKKENRVSKEVLENIWEEKNRSSIELSVDSEPIKSEPNNMDIYENPEELSEVDENGFIKTEKVDIKSVKKINYTIIIAGLVLILICILMLIKVIKEELR